MNELCFLTAKSQERDPDTWRIFKRDESFVQKNKNKTMGGGPIYQAWSNVNPVRVKEPLKGDEKNKNNNNIV